MIEGRRPWLALFLLAGCTHEGTVTARQQAASASPVDTIRSGTWDEPRPDGYSLVRGWIDARVANLRYDKRVFAEVLAPYEGGSFLRTLHQLTYRHTRADGWEQWGTDDIEIYPDGGPNGAALRAPVRYRLALQRDVGGGDRMVRTDWRVLHGKGTPTHPAPDPFATAPRVPLRWVDAPTPPEVLFSPFDDPGRRVIAEIEALIDAQGRDPDGRHTLHAAVFNVYDPEIVDRLIAAHHAGVEVRLLVDGRKLRPWYTWHRGDDRLLEAGVPVLGIRRPFGGAMHNKIAIFDGRRVLTGSMNWEHGARHENHENVVVLEDPEVVAAYAARLHAIAGGVLEPRKHAADPAAPVSVSFAPDEPSTAIVGDLIDRAQESVYLAMFTNKDIAYERGGVRTSLHERLGAAVDRGVEVIAVIDHGIHEASEYYGILSEDDPQDEALEEMGVRVVRADNPFGRYASMHHKFVVIDHETVVTGAFNWYHDSQYLNDEDQLVLRDERLAERFEGELVDLLRRYDPRYDPTAWPQATVRVAAVNDRTVWGEEVILVGGLPQLGAWDPDRGIVLDSARWPVWSADIELPRGVRASFKLVTRTVWGGYRWEPGDDRLLTALDGDLLLHAR